MLLSTQILLWMPASVQAESARAAADDATAIARYQQTVSKEPGNYEAWFGLGVTQAKQRRFQDAITAFRQVIALQPALAEPHNNLAVIYNELGDLRAAVAELEASLKLDPGYATAYENIGDLYVKLAAGAYQKALQHHDREDLKQRYARLLLVHDATAVATAVAPQSSTPPETVNRITTTLTDEPAVLAAVEAWRTAWSKRDMAAYFAAYAADFDTGKRFNSLAAWQQYKQSVISNKAFIRVTLEHIETTRTAEGFRVTFLQHFRSNTLDSDDRKQLLLKQTPDGWKIAHETTE